MYYIERAEHCYITCFERIIPDLPDLLSGESSKMDGWIAALEDSKLTIESSTKPIQDWIWYEDQAFDIHCYERHRKDHDERERN